MSSTPGSSDPAPSHSYRAVQERTISHPDLHFAEGPGLQVAHLLDRGCRRIAYAGTPDPRLTDLTAERRALAGRTCTDLTGTPLATSAEIERATASETVRTWHAQGIDGVVAYNDDIAALVVRGALRQGIVALGTGVVTLLIRGVR